MRRTQRLIAAAVLIALHGRAGRLRGGSSSFDPTDMLDFLDTKKKLPGERKPVFPEGVPGLEQGVPKDLYKGARSSSRDPNARGRRGSAPPSPRPRPKPAKAPRQEAQAAAAPRPRRLRRRRPRPTASPAEAAPPAAAAAAQAEEDRAQAHHRAAARSAGASRRNRPNPPSSNRRAFPGADAERQLHALISLHRH